MSTLQAPIYRPLYTVCGVQEIWAIERWRLYKWGCQLLGICRSWLSYLTTSRVNESGRGKIGYLNATAFEL
jgi:hypothetical protein